MMKVINLNRETINVGLIRMRNIGDILPPLTSSYFVNFPNIEVQMPSLQASTLNDQSMAINVPGSSYHLDSSNDANYGLLRDDDPLPNFPYQPFFGSLHDYPSSSSDFDTTLYQQSTVISTKAAPVLQFEDLQNSNITNARKRKIEEVIENSSCNDLIGNMRGKKLKRNKTHLVVKEKQPAGRQTEEWVANDIKRKLLTPGRRSHKLSDKITSLQKIVSPFGKTDTASVLQEASLYIKLLQEQIQNLFQMLSRTYDSFGPLHLEKAGMEQGDLRSRGLCLVPVSVIQKVAAKEEQIDSYI